MSIASMMVHLHLDRTNEAPLRVAGDLAQRFEARVIGIAAARETTALYFAEGPYAADIVEQERDRLRDRMAELERQFRAALGDRVKALEWRSALDTLSSFLIRETRAADLVIVGADEGTEGSRVTGFLETGDLLLNAGRPVLVVPAQAKSYRMKNILVGWKDTREARRAVRDALPFLQQADTVRVAQRVESTDDPGTVRAALDDVVGWLRLHRVEAGPVVLPATGDANSLDAIADRMDADLIVAGAYGHMRWREWIWGGMTHGLVAHPRHCALLAH